MQELTITLFLPPKELHPNSRCHWRTKAKHTASYRTTAMLQAWADMHCARHKAPKWETATVQATFYFKDNRRRDRDGMLSSLKAAFDGLADAGLIADDSGLTHLPVLVRSDKTNPRVELRIEADRG